jgi:hypothetical protein
MDIIEKPLDTTSAVKRGRGRPRTRPVKTVCAGAIGRPTTRLFDPALTTTENNARYRRAAYATKGQLFYRIKRTLKFLDIPDTRDYMAYPAEEIPIYLQELEEQAAQKIRTAPTLSLRRLF